jgi:4-alpha-glucanotransferase
MSSTSADIRVRFVVKYVTQPGQQLRVVGSAPALGQWNAADAPVMYYRHDGSWSLDVFLPRPTQLAVVEYKYVLYDERYGSYTWEGGKGDDNRTLALTDNVGAHGSVHTRDYWQPYPSVLDKLYKTSAFDEVIFQHPSSSGKASVAAPRADSIVVSFNVRVQQLTPSDEVKVVGSVRELGNWNVGNGLLLTRTGPHVFEGSVPLSRSSDFIDYKYVIHTKKHNSIEWESGENRNFSLSHDISHIFLGDNTFRHASGFRGTGIAVPIFSLRSRNGLGVGEFLDIKPLADWVSSVGANLIQILPINDTTVHGTWWDSYPYSSLSVIALHPIYINLDAIQPLPEDVAQIIAQEKPILNNLKDVDYERVLGLKLKLLSKIFAAHQKQFLGSSECAAFLSANNDWLPPYAVFCALRDHYHTSNYRTWEQYSHITPEEVKQLSSLGSKYYEKVTFYYFLQFHLAKQLREATQYAQSKHVAIKGDLPIGVDPNSVDTWLTPHFFRLSYSTGAPPDYFSDEGQNWGFPTYDWNAMEKDHFGWWRMRLNNMAKYFHAYRIDHILGFFRIWEIAGNAVRGLLGRFNPSVPLWKDELESAGIWDFDRLCDPYVRLYHCDQLFGDDSWWIQQKFFHQFQRWCFQFKDEFRSEKAIEEALKLASDAPPELHHHNNYIKRTLWGLLSNVVLLRDPEDSNKFYPRIKNFDTSSYNDLNDYQKKVLYDKYIDYYYKRQDDEWYHSAMKKLPMMINTTKMLVCGEDLGMIPDCVEPAMDHLGLIALRIERLPRDPKREFDLVEHYPYLAVCTPSCHDMSSIRGWWEEDRGRTQRYYNSILGEAGPAPEFCETWIVKKVLARHLYSRCMWAVFPIQDVFGMAGDARANIDPREEQINQPSNRHHYWKYRIHIPLEDLMHKHELNSEFTHLISASGRFAKNRA